MPAVNGPRLDRIRKQLEDWYLTKRQVLIEAFEESYPYGSVRLTPTEQFMRFMSQTPEDVLNQVMVLQDRYRGDPEAHRKVLHDMVTYTQRMLSIAARAEDEL